MKRDIGSWKISAENFRLWNSIENGREYRVYEACLPQSRLLG